MMKILRNFFGPLGREKIRKLGDALEKEFGVIDRKGFGLPAFLGAVALLDEGGNGLIHKPGPGGGELDRGGDFC